MSDVRAARVVVTKKRDVRTYSELWHASKSVLDTAAENPKGSTWLFLSSLVLTAFTFEAFLNHVGPLLFGHWGHLDRLSPWAKFELICEKLGLTFTSRSGAQPLQTITTLLDFRNTIAHGRSLQLEAKPLMRTVENYQAAYGERLLADWEKLIVDDSFAVRARVDVEEVIRAIHDKCPDPKEHLFTFGSGLSGATLVT